MSSWSQILLQESTSPTMQLLSLFHDYSLAIILMILTFVAGISSFMTTNKMISDSPIITMVEIIWTVVPIFILVFLVLPSLQILYYMEETDPYLTMKVTGHQWYWNYEQMDFDLNFDSYLIPSPLKGEFRLLDVDHRIILPTQKDTRILVGAADVLHCWTIPPLGLKIDAVPGRLNQTFLNIMRPSILFGQCSEICGANHSFMPITVEAISNPLFLTWINK